MGLREFKTNLLGQPGPWKLSTATSNNQSSPSSLLGLSAAGPSPSLVSPWLTSLVSVDQTQCQRHRLLTAHLQIQFGHFKALKV